MKINTSVSDYIGNTPLLELKNIFTPSSNRILAKMENYNPTSFYGDDGLTCLLGSSNYTYYPIQEECPIFAIGWY